ncbi:hypothetical protein BCY90_18450 [Agrobacterium deltaense]|uniref:hypothetical protein n=1 Tax=Agrobacterium TaxID=357 RepID=UPI0007459724|nr:MULTISPECIES: hypothetical protein [Agrobacterium]KVK54045.1 hypothetical protein L901_19355 [Agrobacterium sp. D14]RKF40625.1 hypothetical protein BCY90_18450 [Agrobacterium deltaense]
MEAVSLWFLSTFGWMEQSPVGQAVRTRPYLYPTLMSLHVLGIVVMLGPALMVDLRLLGLGRRSISVTTTIRLLLPISHLGFAIVAITGSAMFTGLVYIISKSAAAPWKFGLIALAAVNILVFHKGVYRKVEWWDIDAVTPFGAKVAALISMLSWTGVIFGGRFLSY